MGRAKVCVLEYEPGHGDLKKAVRAMVKSAKEGGGPKFRTYRPVSGDSNVAVVVFPQKRGGKAAGQGSLEESLGSAKALSLLQKGRVGVRSLRHRDVNISGHSGAPAPFLVVLAGEYHLGKRDQVRAAGQKILDKHKSSKSSLKLSVVTGDAADHRFAVVISADSKAAIDDLNKPRPEIAGLLQELHGLTNTLELVALRYDGALSNP